MEYNTKTLMKYGSAETVTEAVEQGLEFIRKHQYVFSIESSEGNTLLHVDGFNNHACGIATAGEEVNGSVDSPWACACKKYEPWSWFDENLCTYNDETGEVGPDPDKVLNELGIDLEELSEDDG